LTQALQRFLRDALAAGGGFFRVFNALERRFPANILELMSDDAAKTPNEYRLSGHMRSV
jgi:hypothetical protein